MMRFLIAMLALVVLSQPALAQTISGPKEDTPLLMLKQFPPTHPERFLMAYYKLAGAEPDYMAWAKNTPFLKDIPPTDKTKRDTIINRESNRVRQSFTSWNMDEPLIVHTRVLLDDYSTIQEVLNISEFTDRTFFRFSMYGENLAVVPQDIAELGHIILTKDQMEDVLKKAPKGQAVAEILLKPTKADTTQPFTDSGVNYYLMLAQIAEIRLWSDDENPNLLWMRRAEWYKPEASAALMRLKSGL
jgi:hypothetical protein